MSSWKVVTQSDQALANAPLTAERATTLGLQRAPIGRRIAATVIDAVPALLLSLPLVIGLVQLSGGEIEILPIILAAAGVLLVAVYGIVQLATNGRRGQTLGKQAMGLRLVRADTLGRIGFWRAVLRVIVIGASGIIPVLGTAAMLASPLWDRERRGRGLHDYATKAWLVDSRVLDPFDERAMEDAKRRGAAVTLGPVASAPAWGQPAQTPVQAQAGRNAPGAPALPGEVGSLPPLPNYTPGAVSARATEQSAGTAQRTPAAPPTAAADHASYRPAHSVAPIPNSGGAPAGASAGDAAGSPAKQVDPSSRQPVAGLPTSPPAGTIPDAWLPPTANQAAPASTPHTQPSPAEASTPQTPVAPSATSPLPASDIDERTVIRGDDLDDDLEKTRMSIKRRQVVVRIDADDDMALVGTALIGRNPAAPAGVTATHLIPVRDEGRSISKTHLRIDLADGGIEITDLHSTNGSSIERQGVAEPLVPDVAVRAAAGDRILFGDSVIEVVHD